MSLGGAPSTPCSPRPLLPRVAGSAGYDSAVVRLSASAVSELRGDELYEELNLTKDSWPAKRLV